VKDFIDEIDVAAKIITLKKNPSEIF